MIPPRTKAQEVLQALDACTDPELRQVLTTAMAHADHPALRGTSVPAGRKLIGQLGMALEEVTGWKPVDRSRTW